MAVARRNRVYAPKEVVRELNRSRYFEWRYRTALSIDMAEQGSNHPILSACIQTLKHYKEAILTCRIKKLLKIADLVTKTASEFFTILLRQPGVMLGINVLQ